MRKEIVFNVSASKSGAMSILDIYYNNSVIDKNTQYIFVLSVPYYQDTDNIKVLRFPWIKKGWIYRLFFDLFIAPGIVKKTKANSILSLDGLPIRFTKLRQTLYVQNSLAFMPYEFNLFDNTELWIRKHILGKLEKNAINKAAKVIVQTKWMKEQCHEQCDLALDKIRVEYPILDTKDILPFKSSNNQFFYPATPFVYKNHKVILDACILLSKKNISNYSVIFTLSGDENEYARDLKMIVGNNNLPVKFIGFSPRKCVFDYYSNSILLFPSCVESFPVPLTEAKLSNTPIIASNTGFAREILSDYKKVEYFKSNDSEKLSDLMISKIM